MLLFENFRFDQEIWSGAESGPEPVQSGGARIMQFMFRGRFRCDSVDPVHFFSRQEQDPVHFLRGRNLIRVHFFGGWALVHFQRQNLDPV